MKRIVWTTMFALAALVIASCGRSQPESSDTGTPDRSQGESGAPKTGDQTPAEKLGSGDQAAGKGPDSKAESAGGKGSRVLGALGSALRKSFAAGTEGGAPPAPLFKPSPK